MKIESWLCVGVAVMLILLTPIRCQLNISSTVPDRTKDDNLSVSAFGEAQLDTSKKKIGNTSLLLDGNLDYLTVPDSVDWNFDGRLN